MTKIPGYFFCILIFLASWLAVEGQSTPGVLTEHVHLGDRILASTTSFTGDIFTDVLSTANLPYYGAVNTMYARGITLGCSVSPRQFCPDPASSPYGYLARYSMAVFTIRAWSLQLWGDPEAFKKFSPPSTSYYFQDSTPALVGSNADYIQKMWELGLTSGCAGPPTPQFCPNANATNKDIAVFTVRARLAIYFGCMDSCFGLRAQQQGQTNYYDPIDPYDTIPSPLTPPLTTGDPRQISSTAVFPDAGTSDRTNFKWAQAEAKFFGVSNSQASLGCSIGYFCPTTNAARGQMAMEIVRVVMNDLNY